MPRGCIHRSGRGDVHLLPWLPALQHDFAWLPGIPTPASAALRQSKGWLHRPPEKDSPLSSSGMYNRMQPALLKSGAGMPGYG
jgi:hypothetical protein